MRKGNKDKENLAHNIAAIMESPVTPVALFNAMADALTDLAEQDNHFKADSIKRVLESLVEIAPGVGI